MKQTNAFNVIINIAKTNDEFIAVALGGSRARGGFSFSSDYDLFVVLKDESFYGDFYKTIDRFFVEKVGFSICAYMFYQENWGYLHKAVDREKVEYDISILPLSRIREMGIKSTNIVLVDKTGDYTKFISYANDDYNEQGYILMEKKRNIINQTILYFWEYQKCANNQYWEEIKYLERIRRNVMILERAKAGIVFKHFFSPEKNYEVDVEDKEFRRDYIINGDNSLNNTYLKLKDKFLSLLSSEDIKLWYNMF